MSARYEISEGELDVLAITGPEGTYYIDGENIEVRAIRQQSRDIEQLRAELNRERETNAGLRRDLADPPPDIQELALKKCGHFEIVAKLRADLAAAVAARDWQVEATKAAIDACNQATTTGLAAVAERDMLSELAQRRERQLSVALNEVEKLRAFKQAIDSAPVVAVASEIMSHLGSYRSLHAIPGRMPEDGTELIARPEKE